MSNKLVWSSTMTQDMLLNLDEKSLKLELVDWGYEPDMLANMDKQALDDLIISDDYMWQHDSVYFEDDIRPMIEKQTRNGIVLMSGSVGRWTGNHSGGKAVYAEDLIGGDICQDCDEIAIYDVDGGLQWQGCHHDGCHYMNLYALPEEEAKIREFIQVCCPDVIEEETMMGEDGQTDEESLELIVNDFIGGNYDPEWLNDWCDFSKVPEVCEPIRNTSNLAVEESCNVKEDYESDVKQLKQEVLKDMDIMGHNYYDKGLGSDEFKDAVKDYIGEAKVNKNNVEALKSELEEIKADYEDFGADGFYGVSFDSFKKEFPIFTSRVILPFLKELELLEPDEITDENILNQLWKEKELILPEDWKALLDGATQMVTTRVDKGVQWEKIWKKYYKAFDEK